MDVEAYMAFSLKSFNAQISFNLFQTFFCKKMYFTEKLKNDKNPQQEDGRWNLHSLLLLISAYPPQNFYFSMQNCWQILCSVSGVLQGGVF